MAEKIISPGVFTKEIDASFLPAAIGDIGAVVVGPTVKGPALSPTVVNSYSEFQAKFGDVFKSGSSYYQYLTSHTAKNYLEHSPSLTVVRIMGAGYSHATASVATDSTVTSTTYSSASLFISGTNNIDNQQITIGGVDFTFVDDVTNFANDQTSTQLYVQKGAGVVSASSATALRDVINNSSSLHGLAISASLIPETATRFGLDKGGRGVGIALSSSEAGTHVNYSLASSSADFIFSASFGVAAAVGGAGKTSLEGGSSTTGAGSTSFILHTLGDGKIMNSDGTTTTPGAGGTNNILSDGTSNNLRWEVSNRNTKKGTFTLLVRRGDDVINRKQILETWNNLSLDPNSNNYISKMIGDQVQTLRGTTDDPFLQYSGSYPVKSKYIRVEPKESTIDYLDENGNIRINSLSASLPALGSGSYGGAFGGGLDGTQSGNLSASLYESIGQTTQGFDLNVAAQKNQYLKALNLLKNADEFDFNLLLIPGIIRAAHASHTEVVSKAIQVCEDRGDAFVLIDTVEHSVDNIGTVTTQAKAMNSNYASTYWPWIQVPDQQLGGNVWVPPSVSMAGTYAFNDKIGAPWFAPAGLNRGVMGNVIQAKRKLTQKNRDTLYEKNVNPIATFPGQGVVVWGQKTLQKKASALDRVNVRRLLIKLKKFISSSSRFLVFEQNNAVTREKFLGIVNPYLEKVRAQSGLSAFKVVMDDTNNTQDVIDRNQLYGQIFVQPTRTAEFIILDFTVQPTGATFSE